MCKGVFQILQTRSSPWSRQERRAQYRCTQSRIMLHNLLLNSLNTSVQGILANCTSRVQARLKGMAPRWPPPSCAASHCKARKEGSHAAATSHARLTITLASLSKTPSHPLLLHMLGRLSTSRTTGVALPPLATSPRIISGRPLPPSSPPLSPNKK